MKTILTFLLLMSAHVHLWSQLTTERQVMAASGNLSTSGAISLSWTLGEAMTETQQAAGLTVTQGFHQENLSASGATEGKLPYAVEVFPNPVSMTLHVTADAPVPLTAELFSLEGKQLLRVNLGLPITRLPISLAGLPAATYLLMLKDETGSFQSFKIQKI